MDPGIFRLAHRAAHGRRRAGDPVATPRALKGAKLPRSSSSLAVNACPHLHVEPIEGVAELDLVEERKTVGASLVAVRVRIRGLHGEPYPGLEFAQGERSLNAVELRHGDVEERDLRPLLECELNCFGPVLCFENRNPLDRFEYGNGQQAAHLGVVVREK